MSEWVSDRLWVGEEEIAYEVNDFKKLRKCPGCDREFPMRYAVKNPGFRASNRGVKQLMSLHAFYNFKRHVKKCVVQGSVNKQDR